MTNAHGGPTCNQRFGFTDQPIITNRLAKITCERCKAGIGERLAKLPELEGA